MKTPILCLIYFIIFITLTSCVDSLERKDAKVRLEQSVVNNSAEFDEEYAHVVYFWFKNPDNKEGRKVFEKSLRTFLDNSAYAKTSFIGTPPRAIREVVDDTFTYNLIVSFESAAAQKAYQQEQAHKVFIADCSHLWEKVIVYDANTIE